MAGINESATDVTATMNGVFKIEDETTDRLIIEAYDENDSLIQSYDFNLSFLNLEKPVSVEFEDMFVSLTDTEPYTENFTITNRPEGTHLVATSSDTEIFTVDTTNIENGSFDIIAAKTGNGVLTLSVLDSNDEEIASAILPVSATIEIPEFIIAWYAYNVGGVQQPSPGIRITNNGLLFFSRWSYLDENLEKISPISQKMSERNFKFYGYDGTVIAQGIPSGVSVTDDMIPTNYKADIETYLGTITEEQLALCRFEVSAKYLTKNLTYATYVNIYDMRT